MISSSSTDLLVRPEDRMLQVSKSCLKAFAGFHEGRPSFPPTFKVERLPGVTHQQERTPSYCDRILWKSTEALATASQRSLCSPAEVSSSDHKPVYATFEVHTPLARGELFQSTLEKELFPVLKLRDLKGHGIPGTHP